MRLLFLSHRPPFPPDKGDKIRSYHMLEHLRRRHEIHVACAVDDARDLESLPTLRGRVASLAFARVDGALRRLRLSLLLPTPTPLTVGHFYSGALQAAVDDVLDRVPIDGLFAYSSAMACYVFRSRHAAGKLRGVLKALDFIDVDSAKWRNYAARHLPPMAWIYRREARTMARYECHIARTFDRLCVISGPERRHFPDIALQDRLAVIPNGVDLEYFVPGNGTLDAAAPPRLVFTGVMDYWPNVEGVTWFVHHVWPAIRARFPQAAFDIVGARPGAGIRALAVIPGVVVHGRVPDVRQFLRGARIAVVPLRVARGIQNKLLEAMAMGLPALVTPEALEGVAARPGPEVRVACDATGFAAAAIELLEDADAGARVGAAARAYVERAHRWSSNLATLDEWFPA